jgi:hypothetical protein
MNKKRLYLAALCIVLTCSVFAARTSFQEQTENWLQRSSTETVPTPTPPTEPESEEWGSIPVGDALPLLFSFCFVYVGAVLLRTAVRRRSFSIN